MADLHILSGAAACKNCRHWASIHSDFADVAECRRYPPARSETFIAARMAADERLRLRERGRGLWPLVDEASHCGEFTRG